ncbi:uncharacterized protein LOC118937707 [Oncorhynchus mykiss]|uniref:uncharacterized protein LOC118937707 n=1 Tax=Oncorhynchus mykiss TaxID=8022 RepID=UPI0018779FD3|nr:uncharacterized protein LOC118937707 [Oncorhynchus mykiss]
MGEGTERDRSFSIKGRRKYEKDVGGGGRCWSIMGRQWAFVRATLIVVSLGALFLSLGAWTVLGLEDIEEESPGEAESLPPARPLDYHLCVELVLRTTARGGAIGLLRGLAAFSVVWIAEVLSGSNGLVASVLRAPFLGLLIGLGVGAADGVGRVEELLEPGVWWKVVGNGVSGTGVGARVAAVSGVVIAGLMSIMTVRAVKNVAKSGEIRMAQFITVSVAVGAARMVLCLAPGCMATGALVVSILGTRRDLHNLGALVVLGLGWCAGQRWLGGGGGVSVFLVWDKLGQLSPRHLIGRLVGLTVAVVGSMCLGFSLQMYSALVSVLLGASIAFLSWRGGEAVCKVFAEVVERLFVAISINTYHGQEERLFNTFGWGKRPLDA